MSQLGAINVRCEPGHAPAVPESWAFPDEVRAGAIVPDLGLAVGFGNEVAALRL